LGEEKYFGIYNFVVYFSYNLERGKRVCPTVNIDKTLFLKIKPQ
jgi:hypothetical protein